MSFFDSLKNRLGFGKDPIDAVTLQTADLPEHMGPAHENLSRLGPEAEQEGLDRFWQAEGQPTLGEAFEQTAHDMDPPKPHLRLVDEPAVENDGPDHDGPDLTSPYHMHP